LSVWERVLAHTGPHRFALISTQRPEIVRIAFDDHGFPWCMQGQVLLLTPPDTAVPEIGAKDAIALLAPTITDTKAWNLPGVVAQLRAGVDGDVAVLYCVSSTVESALVGSIEHAGSAQGIECQRLSEAEFTAALTAK
jgi:hypothetical protein